MLGCILEDTEGVASRGMEGMELIVKDGIAEMIRDGPEVGDIEVDFGFFRVP